MQYMMLLYADETVGAEFSAEDMGRAMDIMGAYNDVLKKAGALVMTAPLQQTDEARTLRMEGGETAIGTFTNEGGVLRVHDGPYAETREQLGGFYLIEARQHAGSARLGRQVPGRAMGLDRGARTVRGLRRRARPALSETAGLKIWLSFCRTSPAPAVIGSAGHFRPARTGEDR